MTQKRNFLDPKSHVGPPHDQKQLWNLELECLVMPYTQYSTIACSKHRTVPPSKTTWALFEIGPKSHMSQTSKSVVQKKNSNFF